jgi:membrane protein implicated in regulation of membrane protease activity
VIIYSDDSWPLWIRIAIAAIAVTLLAVLTWRYVRTYWRKR